MKPDKTLERDYPVDQGDVSISVVVGDAQFGTIDVRFDGDSEPLGRQDNLLRVSLGRGVALIGKDLIVRTLISDVNPFTNNVIVTHVLSGGHQNLVESIPGQAAASGDVLYFRSVFHLVAQEDEQ